MERTRKRIRVKRYANPLPDNFLKKGWLKRLGGRVGQIAGAVTGREALTNTGNALLAKGREQKAQAIAKEQAKKNKSVGGTLGTMDMSIDLPAKVGTPSGAGERIKKIAGDMPASDVSRGQKILEKGVGILTNAQKEFQRGQTDPSRLPKTRALKEAEQKLLLPQKAKSFSGAASVADTIKGIDKKYLIIGGIVLAIGLVTFFILRK